MLDDIPKNFVKRKSKKCLVPQKVLQTNSTEAYLPAKWSEALGRLTTTTRNKNFVDIKLYEGMLYQRDHAIIKFLHREFIAKHTCSHPYLLFEDGSEIVWIIKTN